MDYRCEIWIVNPYQRPMVKLNSCVSTVELFLCNSSPFLSNEKLFFHIWVWCMLRIWCMTLTKQVSYAFCEVSEWKCISFCLIWRFLIASAGFCGCPVSTKQIQQCSVCSASRFYSTDYIILHSPQETTVLPIRPNDSSSPTCAIKMYIVNSFHCFHSFGAFQSGWHRGESLWGPHRSPYWK